MNFEVVVRRGKRVWLWPNGPTVALRRMSIPGLWLSGRLLVDLDSAGVVDYEDRAVG